MNQLEQLKIYNKVVANQYIANILG